MAIPVIDIFAGPGGLGEGFSALRMQDDEQAFKIVLSIEKHAKAHETLTLRSFFRQFNPDEVPEDYYEFIRGKISLSQLYERWPEEASHAKEEAWLAELGGKNFPDELIDTKIRKALAGEPGWLLIGGPPCQAYSVVGRSRRQETTLDGRKDKRVGLYKQYLRILAVHNPSIFVMENVKGLLSAEAGRNPVFKKILKDLSSPAEAYLSENSNGNGQGLNCPGYKIYSLVKAPRDFKDGNPVFKETDFVIEAEKYGVPQTRHRVILLGIRKDMEIIPDILKEENKVPISSLLSGLPRLRSGLSKIKDSSESWEKIVRSISLKKTILNKADKQVVEKIKDTLKKIAVPQKGRGGECVLCADVNVEYRPDWFLDENINGVCNHSSRGHMETDIYRYLFVSCFAKVYRRSPKLEDFPKTLLPKHQNVKDAIKFKKFTDRFRVQLWNKPSKTITSHISKDGHYYIHPDPTQCRSFTVREAARIQTFPDNYFFCGPRTSQFIQVGNAVPPLLANKVASIVYNIFESLQNERDYKYSERLENV